MFHGPLSFYSYSLSWEMIVPTASGQGLCKQVRGCFQMPALDPEETSFPGSTGWVSFGGPILSIQIIVSFSR